ncbi:hypothetical protein G6F35_012647 [Rhizopus arrhizus]|nr:hypothetical protein G6F35_012647 [Rhizopus arrhizus]
MVAAARFTPTTRLDDKEILALDRWLRAHTRERFGPVRSVEPVQVFELGFEGVNLSKRHNRGRPVGHLEGAGTMTAARRGWDAPLSAWFQAQGWKPAPFQRETWRRYLDGQSGLLHTPTGSGKTLAAFGGPLLEALADPATAHGAAGAGPRVLWVTPLRALAADTTRALSQAAQALEVDWTVALRTGDASARDKRLARQGKADVLVITPESLALLLSYADASSRFRALRCVVVDEWHELLGNKRGVLLQLCLAPRWWRERRRARS